MAVLLALALFDERRRARRLEDQHNAREAELELRLRDAQNRLISASSEGLAIPPSDVPEKDFVSPRDEEALDPILIDFLSQYEGPARPKYERMIRARLGAMTPLQILKSFELGVAS